MKLVWIERYPRNLRAFRFALFLMEMCRRGRLSPEKTRVALMQLAERMRREHHQPLCDAFRGFAQHFPKVEIV